MHFFDGHCDTASELLNRGENLSKNTLHIDLERLKRYDNFTQVFAVFISPEFYQNPMNRAINIIENFTSQLQKNNIPLCKNFDDITSSESHINAFLSLEGGEPIKNTEDLKILYDMGIRMIAPTWNFSNQLASGIMEEPDTGLTPLGREIIAEMDRLGIILDLSHISKKSFFEAAECTKRPLVASHSNLRSVVNHKRNLTDEQFMVIKNSGGVCGINLYPPFFGEDISRIKDHIDRFLYLGGEENIALGCDFDGVDALPRGISGVQDLEKTIKSLPYPEKIKEKLAYKNFLRVIKAHNC